MEFIYRPPDPEKMTPAQNYAKIKIGGPLSEERIDYLRRIFLLGGWKIDKDDEEELSFSFLEDEDHEWVDINYKKTGRCVRFNARQIINVQMKEKE